MVVWIGGSEDVASRDGLVEPRLEESVALSETSAVDVSQGLEAVGRQLAWSEADYLSYDLSACID